MKKGILVVLLAAIAFAAYWFLMRKTQNGFSGEKQVAIAIKKHSDKFNTSVSTMMSAYFDMQNAFVLADTSNAKESCKKFIALIDSVDFNELKDDSAAVIQNAKLFFTVAKANAVSLLTQTDITEMRKDFNINYNGPTMYYQNCPMAFGEDKGANWISSTKEIINPYMGKNHPEYKGSMLHCGEVKDSL